MGGNQNTRINYMIKVNYCICLFFICDGILSEAVVTNIYILPAGFISIQNLNIPVFADWEIVKAIISVMNLPFSDLRHDIVLKDMMLVPI